MESTPAFIALAGPTASGKSALALALAQRLPLEIISAAVGYELSKNSEDEAAEFAREYIDEMIEIYREMQREK